ncbi:GPI anchored protein-like protein [Aaosphaeria arxii CBS 175.79]|uniref:GPI anchored protein-like protein n=1 Tax=Aaosphaeria arxii CBS 175.79 TaxID=1450172 RepID=A0A6A5YA92_9PLEO|nr:GPI anchored protein-like protein [Aaosphaeria arxii CBS 175.79]KAF2021720.1 GPI anchored protein-like protein [Aaosphaeria arxii CBS 175.79]
MKTLNLVALFLSVLAPTPTYATPVGSSLEHLPRARHGFQHPGALHTAADIRRVKHHVKEKDEPWFKAFQHLQSRNLAQTTWKATPQTILVRTATPTANLSNNYQYAYRDAHSAYQQTLLWLITDNETYADAAVKTLDAWSSKLEDIDGNEDKYLAAGLYGYQFANAAELLRSYRGWPATRQEQFATMLTDIFARYNRAFLDHHNDKPDFYYANWDFANIVSLMAIGIFTDNATMYDFAVDYFLTGPDDGAVANGALPFFSIANFTEDGGKTLMQGQEAGRDQGHALLCMALLGVIGQQGHNQGRDLYGAFGHQILNAAEYAGKYNTNHSVPYTPYESWEGVLPVVSAKARGDVRPGFEALFAHYSDVKGLNASWTKAYRDYVVANLTAKVEGGGGDYGPNSGGFDALGHGTLMYRITGS